MTQHWHRAEIDSGGRVVSIAPVDPPEKNGHRILYVQASSDSLAVIIARNAWNALTRPKRVKRSTSPEGECYTCGHKSDAKERLRVLEEVRGAWRQLPSMGAFAEWLRVQVESAGGRAHRPARGSSSDEGVHPGTPGRRQGEGESCSE